MSSSAETSVFISKESKQLDIRIKAFPPKTLSPKKDFGHAYAHKNLHYISVFPLMKKNELFFSKLYKMSSFSKICFCQTWYSYRSNSSERDYLNLCLHRTKLKRYSPDNRSKEIAKNKCNKLLNIKFNN